MRPSAASITMQCLLLRRVKQLVHVITCRPMSMPSA